MKRYTVDVEEIKTRRVVVRAYTVEEAQAKAIDRKWMSSVCDETDLLEVVSVPREMEDPSEKARKDVASALWEIINRHDPEMAKELWSMEIVKGTTWGQYFASELRRQPSMVYIT